VVLAIILFGCLTVALLIPGWFTTRTGVYGPGMGRMFDECPWCGTGIGLGSLGLVELLLLLVAVALVVVIAAALIAGVIWLIRSSASSRREEAGDKEETVD
ncbi:MAG: hypothetical protein ACP5JJ_10360, partial [Anaerolineae bacterium]